MITATNASGEEMPFSYEMYYDAQNGNDVVLTIDEVIQHYLEKTWRSQPMITRWRTR